MKILFFIESLILGGKQRRLLELIQYILSNTDHKIKLVITDDDIHYEYVHNLDLSLTIIKRKYLKKDPRPFFKFYRVCKEFQPDIIHSWGVMTTIYSIPAKILLKVPLISSMIADTEKRFSNLSLSNFFFRIGCSYSDLVISNSRSGLEAYNVISSKSKVIYNGVNMARFNETYDINKLRKELNIKTRHIVIMVAAFSDRKDYDLFLEVAKALLSFRTDVTFLGIGHGDQWFRIQKRVDNEKITNVHLAGKKKNVEKYIAISDIGLLCTFSEGISNSIIEYMAMGKPVIVTDTTGGSSEIVIDDHTGYCVDRSVSDVVSKINFLLDNKELRNALGSNGKKRIEDFFSIGKMGEEHIKLYDRFAKEK